MSAKSKVLMASVLTLAAIPVFAAEETSSGAAIASAPLPSAIVKCPGVTSIPVTADAEQALPLQLVGNLACGEIVTIVADSEGYTAHIRASDGKDGYVARMYLATTQQTATAKSTRRVSASAATVNGVARWHAGAPGCDEFLSQGRHVESITANGITVQVSVQDTGWKYRANIAVSNASSRSVDVTPGIITLDELQPRMRILPAADSKLIARTSTHQVLWTLTDAVPSPSAVSDPQRRTSDQQHLVYRDSETPDYLNPHLTLATARPAAFAREESIDVQAIALKYASVKSNDSTAGVMWFARDPGARELSLRVPVGDTVFDFAFAFDQKK